MTVAAQAQGVAGAPSKAKLWVGWALGGLASLLFLFSATMKLTRQPQVVEPWVKVFGYPESTLFGIGLIELTCVVLYAIPRTAVLGAVLLTGYLGGAVATHVRIGDSPAGPIVVGIVAWAGLYLRDERLRALLPLRKR